jgi:hypothetical protein
MNLASTRTTPSPVTARPGAAFYGAPVGILLLDCVAPFVPGSVGNASTYRRPVRYKTVPGLTVERLIRAPDDSVADTIVTCARELSSEGARFITANCGFMIRHQRAVQEAFDGVVALSSMLLAPILLATLSSRQALGIVTASADSLTDDLLNLAGVPAGSDIAIVGLDDSPAFSAAFMDCSGELDLARVENEVVAAVTGLLDRRPDIGAILLECSELPPYAAVVQSVTGRPVFDFTSMIEFFAGSLDRSEFHGLY